MNWLRATLSSSEESSFGRFASLLCLVACISWDTAIVAFIMLHYAQLKVTAADLDPAAGVLMGQSAFCITFYGVNKWRDANQDKYKELAPGEAHEVRQ